MLKINKYILFIIIIILIYLIYYYYQIKNYYQLFYKNRYLLIKNYFTEKECNDLLLLINKELGSTDSEFTWNEKNRKNLRVPLVNETKDIIKKVYTDKNLEKIWKHFTPNTVLAELSIFLSYPGAISQPWHRDVKLEKGYGNMLTVGIALEDITEDMGPLELYPKSTKVKDTYLEKNIFNDNFLEDINYKKQKMICPKGSLILWDSKLIHRGGKNSSSMIRPLFYFSFLEGNKDKPRDATYSLKSIYKDIIYVNKLM